MKYSYVTLHLFSLALLCSGCSNPSTGDHDKRIEAVILTDFAVSDTTYAYSAFLQLGQKVRDRYGHLKAVGFIYANLPRTNRVYEELYGTQQSFPVTRIPLAFKSKQNSDDKTYWKLDLHGINNYHNVKMIKKIHSELFESDFTLITSDSPDTKIKKKDDFAIYYYQYGSLSRLE